MLLTQIQKFQSKGQWGPRHFDKAIFNAPIPRFSEKDPVHAALSEAARKAEEIAAALTFEEGIRFQPARKLVRDAIAEAGIDARIDALVTRLLEI